MSGSLIARAVSSASEPLGLPAPPAQEMKVVLNNRKERSNAQKIVHFKINLYPPPITLYAFFVNTREGFFINIFY